MDWGLNSATPRKATRTASSVRPMPRPDTRNRYVYEDGYATSSVTPRPRPAWYDDSYGGSQTAENCDPPRPRARPAYSARADQGAAPRFYWPLRGTVISDFGMRNGGERNDGINIAADYDKPIYASATGTVSYVGSELKSYGNLVLIRHGGNYVTAYAHAERLTVRRGDTVRAGDIIGYTGASGDVSRPQLHFEIRRGVTPINPRSLLVSDSWRSARAESVRY